MLLSYVSVTGKYRLSDSEHFQNNDLLSNGLQGYVIICVINHGVGVIIKFNNVEITVICRDETSITRVK